MNWFKNLFKIKREPDCDNCKWIKANNCPGCTDGWPNTGSEARYVRSMRYDNVKCLVTNSNREDYINGRIKIRNICEFVTNLSNEQLSAFHLACRLQLRERCLSTNLEDAIKEYDTKKEEVIRLEKIEYVICKACGRTIPKETATEYEPRKGEPYFCNDLHREMYIDKILHEENDDSTI